MLVSEQVITLQSECYNSSDRSELAIAFNKAELTSQTSIKKLSLAESFFMVRFRPLEPTRVGLTTRDRQDVGIPGFAL